MARRSCRRQETPAFARRVSHPYLAPNWDRLTGPLFILNCLKTIKKHGLCLHLVCEVECVGQARHDSYGKGLYSKPLIARAIAFQRIDRRGAFALRRNPQGRVRQSPGLFPCHYPQPPRPGHLDGAYHRILGPGANVRIEDPSPSAANRHKATGGSEGPPLRLSGRQVWYTRGSFGRSKGRQGERRGC
jgi:hypothetical protein